MKVLLLTILLAFTGIASAEIYYDSELDMTVINPIANIDGGLGDNYFHIRSSTTGYIQFNPTVRNAPNAFYCSSSTPEGVNRLDRFAEVLAKAPRSISANRDCSEFKIEGEDGITVYASDYTARSTNSGSTIGEGSMCVHLSAVNQNPIIADTFNFNGAEYDRYFAEHNLNEEYRTNEDLTKTFSCAILSSSEHAQMIKLLGFTEVKKGIIYLLWAQRANDSRYPLIDGYRQCGYGLNWITSYRLEA